MKNTLKMNATKARQNFFSLIELVAKENITVTITKAGLKDQVQITKISNQYKLDPQLSQADIIKETAGSLKSKVTYKKDEKEIAKNVFIQKYNDK